MKKWLWLVLAMMIAGCEKTHVKIKPEKGMVMEGTWEGVSWTSTVADVSVNELNQRYYLYETSYKDTGETYRSLEKWSSDKYFSGVLSDEVEGDTIQEILEDPDFKFEGLSILPEKKNTQIGSNVIDGQIYKWKVLKVKDEISLPFGNVQVSKIGKYLVQGKKETLVQIEYWMPNIATVKIVGVDNNTLFEITKIRYPK